ncbi:uncharacterized protein LOC18026524 [Eutrema salsugineum]|nr:uncharacterized protein LOC18026524 [Eutrema salsugineum]
MKILPSQKHSLVPRPILCKNMSEKPEKQELPLETSPYTKYENIEDYKKNAYGTSGHEEVKPGQGGGTTDAPTLSGSAPPSAVDSANQQAKK